MDASATETAAERILRQVPGWEDRPVAIEPAIPVLASPSWRGVDGESLVARDTETGATLFIKAMHADTAFYIDVATAFDAAEKAGAAGIGPRVILADVPSGVLVSEDLSPGWRVAGLEACRDPGFIEKVFAVRRKVAGIGPLGRDADVFADIERFFAMVKDRGAATPADTPDLVAMMRFAKEQIGASGTEKVPIHGDGNVSNILLDKAGNVLLVDWDRAAMGDPLEDVGSFLVEAFAFEPEARDAFFRHVEGADERLFHRARVLGAADDLRWGLIGAIQAHSSPRVINEFYKFANWRFLRARMAARSPRFGEQVRRAA